MEADELKLEEYRAYYDYYKDCSNYYQSIVLRTEAILIIPILGITAYNFQELSQNNVGYINFLITLIVSAAPLIASCVGFILATRRVEKVIKIMTEQLKTNSLEPINDLIDKVNQKIHIIRRWVIFTYFAILMSFTLAILIKFQFFNLLVHISISLFILYCFALCLFFFCFYSQN